MMKRFVAVLIALLLVVAPLAIASAEALPSAATQESEQPSAAPQESEQPSAAPQESEQPSAATQESEQPSAAPQESEQPSAATQESEQPSAAPQESEQPSVAPQESEQPSVAPQDASEKELLDSIIKAQDYESMAGEPQIAFVSPEDGDTYYTGSTIPFQIRVDNGRGYYVSCFVVDAVNEELIETLIFNDPITYDPAIGTGYWNTAGLPEGAYQMLTAVFDASGNVIGRAAAMIDFYLVDDVFEPTIGGFEIGAASPTTMHGFALAATGVEDDWAGMDRVEFWVYRAEDGPGSYQMIQGVDRGGGVWDGSFSTDMFGGKRGTYIFNVAAYDNNGNVANSGQKTVVIQGDSNGPAVGAFEIGAPSPTTMEGFAVALKGVNDSSGVQEVQFWVCRAEDGPGSYKMFRGNDHGNGTWDALFNISMFGGKAGTYVFNAAAYDAAGNLTNTDTKAIVVQGDTEGPAVGAFEIGAPSPTTMENFAIALNGVSDPSGVREVQFWVCRAEDGPGSYKMFRGNDHGNGTWDALFSTSMFDGKAGTYVFNAAAYDAAGNLTNTDTKTIVVQGDTEGPAVGAFEIGAPSPTTMDEFAIALNGVSDPSGVREVQFWVYRAEDGPGSYKMFWGNDHGNGVWDALFRISMFDGQKGTYVFNAAAYDARGNLTNTETKTIVVQ